jgi:hypothetical protein
MTMDAPTTRVVEREIRERASLLGAGRAHFTLCGPACQQSFWSLVGEADVSVPDRQL